MTFRSPGGAASFVLSAVSAKWQTLERPFRSHVQGSQGFPGPATSYSRLRGFREHAKDDKPDKPTTRSEAAFNLAPVAETFFR